MHVTCNDRKETACFEDKPQYKDDGSLFLYCRSSVVEGDLLNCRTICPVTIAAGLC